MAYFSDTFDGANDALVSSRTGWTAGTTGVNNAKLNGSSGVKFTDTGNDSQVVYNEKGAADHWCECVAGANFAGAYWPLFVRCDGTRSNLYAARFDAGLWELWIINGGGLSRISNTAGSVSAGDVIRLEASGTDLILKKNGVTVLTNNSLGFASNTKVGMYPRGTVAGAEVMTSWASGLPGETAGSSDTEKPILTGTPTVGTKTSSTIQITGPAGSDNVGITAYEFSTDGGATWPLSSPTLPYTITSLAAGTSYTIGMRAKDAANNVSDPPIYVTTSTLASDTAPPTMNGSITVGTKTSGSISISYPAASDNVAVTGYEVSTNGSTWSDNGTSLSYTFLGLSALTSYTLYVRAYDAAGNRAATPLTVTTSTYRAGDTAANIIANTGPVGGNPAGFLYAFASTVTSTDWLSYTIVSGPTPSGGTLDANPDGTFTYVGPDAATLVVQPEVNGVNAAETITVTLYDQSPDTELPVLTGSITVTNLTSTSYDLSWPTGTDDTGVTGYEYSLNGGTSWTDNGNVTTKAITGRAPESTDQVRVRAYDAAGNKSTPALSMSVTLLAGPDVTEPLLTDPTAYASGPTTASGTVTTNEATGTLYFLRNNSATATDVAVEAGLSQAVTAAGIQTVNVTGLTASTPSNYIHYLHIDAAGNRSLVSSSAAFATPAAPAPGLKVIGAQPTKLIARPITRPIAIKQTD